MILHLGPIEIANAARIEMKIDTGWRLHKMGSEIPLTHIKRDFLHRYYIF